MIALIFLIFLVAPAAFGDPNYKCPLIFEGAFNRLMVPTNVTRNNMPVWQSVNETNGFLFEEFFDFDRVYRFQSFSWSLNSPSWGDRRVGKAHPNIVDGCPSQHFKCVVSLVTFVLVSNITLCVCVNELHF